MWDRWLHSVYWMALCRSSLAALELFLQCGPVKEDSKILLARLLCHIRVASTAVSEKVVSW